MRHAVALLCATLLVLSAAPARAQLGSSVPERNPLPQMIDCRAAAEMAEQAEGLPAGLLFAIGKIESGRPNPATGQVEPYPWVTNQGGQDHWFSSAQDAIAWTAQTQAHGLTSIDVGCFQVNLFYHPDAFATLEEAFDPLSNAMYAARFLNALYRRAGGWPLAVAQYHSADPALGGPYGDRVYSAWNGTWPGGSSLGGIVRASFSQRFAGVSDPVVIRLSPQALGIRVVLPSWASAPPAAEASHPAPVRAGMATSMAAASADAMGGRVPRGVSHLPRVYRP